MAYRVDLTERAARNLRRIYQTINAKDAAQARIWFHGLEKTIISLDEHPARGAIIAEDDSLRHLHYGRRRHVCRIIYAIDEPNRVIAAHPPWRMQPTLWLAAREPPSEFIP